jgi:GT2 family glycosyltransferase
MEKAQFESVRPNVAVVVLTYNRSDVTNLLFDSVARAKNYADYELIVVDNDSKPHEREKIMRFFKYLKLRGLICGDIECSQRNLGFPAGNNVGLRKAFANKSFTHICLLNNDTIVADGWLDDLVDAAGDRALVGPVSNSVGNEQVIPTEYKIVGCNRYTVDNVREFAQAWKTKHKRITLESPMLGFFCVLGRREVFETVGLLDEAFGIGTYEDDDYCERVKAKDYQLLIARHVFVHHWGSATFNKIASRSREKLTQKNRKYFEQKHNKFWKGPVTKIPDSMVQESLSCEPEYYRELELRYADMLRMQIWGMHSTLEIVASGSLRHLVCVWLASRITGLKGTLPDPIVYAVQFANKMCLGTRRDRATSIATAKRVIAHWHAQMRQSARHFRMQARATRLRKPTNGPVVILPMSSYRGPVQRPQHLAREIAALDHSVVWLDPSSPEHIVGRKASWLITEIEQAAPAHLMTIQAGGIDYSNFYASGISGEETKSLINALDKVVDWQSARIVVQSLFWAPAMPMLKQKLGPQGRIIYDCMDDHIAFGSATYEIEMLEHELLADADVVVTTSDLLKEAVQGREHRPFPA